MWSLAFFLSPLPLSWRVLVCLLLSHFSFPPAVRIFIHLSVRSTCNELYVFYCQHRHPLRHFRIIKSSPQESRSLSHLKSRNFCEMATFSQSSQPSPTYGPTSLSLYKLSFCTTAMPGAKMVWTHLSSRANMFAVFDRVRSIGLGGSISESRILKLTCEADLLVCIPSFIVLAAP